MRIFINPNKKSIKTTEGELTIDVIKEHFFENTMYLML